MILSNGTILGDRYEIVEKIGTGGMAIVYRGKDKKLERNVTIKILREEFTNDEDFISKFKIEARSAARLSHPNIVNVYDVGEEGNIYYIIMEYIHGDTLKQAIIKKAPFDSKSTINVSIQMAMALSHAHKNHVVHRDIKPQNILVGADGVIKVADFGIARATTTSTVTTSANAIGSVYYFSPEQARGGYVDEKSDIYSLGITMFEMITGHIPFEGETSVAIALKHINEELPDIRQYNPNITKSLEGIIKKATMKRSDERYTNIDLLLADLIRARTDSSGDFIEDLPSHINTATIQMSDEQMKDISRNRMRPSETIQEIEIPQVVENESKRKLKISKDDDDFENTNYIEDIPKRTFYNDNKKEENFPEIDIMNINRNSNTVQNNDFEDNYQNLKPTPRRTDRSSVNRNYPQSRKETSYKRNNQDEDDYDRSKEKKVIIAAIITALIIISAITVVGIKFLNASEAQNDIFQGEKNYAPLLLGKIFEQAQAENPELKIVKDGEEYSDYEIGLISSQDIEEGQEISKDTEIKVKVSLGLEKHIMINLLNKDEDAAREELAAIVKNIEIDVDYEFSNDTEIGHIMSQNPEEGEGFVSTDKITLIVSKGEEFKKVPVPNLIGMTEAAAEKELNKNGLIRGEVVYVDSDAQKGNVIKQTVDEGREVNKNSVVGIVVSKGKPEQEQNQKEDNTQPEQNNAQQENNTQPEENNAKPEENSTQPEENNVQPENSNNTSQNSESNSNSEGTRNFPIYLPEGGTYGDTVHVKVLKINEDGTTTTVVDTQKETSSFPYSVSITTKESEEVQCFIDGNLIW